MPDIKSRNQPFDLEFHPNEPVVYTALLTGELKAFRYDDTTGEASTSWSVRPTKRTMRSVDVGLNGQHVWAGGKTGNLFQIDAATGGSLKEREAQESPINRVYCVNDRLVASGDDEGVIKFWDPRQEEAIRTYTQHFDYISDFTYFEDKRQLVTTSGDGHLSVIDIRSNKPSPSSVSDDQEDELLSIAPIKGGTKSVVGTTLGVISVWDRSKGWQDCVDRIPGHPASIDAMVALSHDIIATGSEDGMIRVIQVSPHKFSGVIATHEEYPIERIKVDRNNKWLGSVSHDDCVKLTDVEDLFEESDNEEEEDVEMADDPDSDDSDEEMDAKPKKQRKKGGLGDMGEPQPKEESSFFDDL